MSDSYSQVRSKGLAQWRYDQAKIFLEQKFLLSSVMNRETEVIVHVIMRSADLPEIAVNEIQTIVNKLKDDINNRIMEVSRRVETVSKVINTSLEEIKTQLQLLSPTTSS